jgi:hypothetical protein
MTSPSAQQQVCTQARLMNGFWLNVYTVNDEALKLFDGGFLGETEPSISF